MTELNATKEKVKSLTDQVNRLDALASPRLEIWTQYPKPVLSCEGSNETTLANSPSELKRVVIVYRLQPDAQKERQIL